MYINNISERESMQQPALVKLYGNLGLLGIRTEDREKIVFMNNDKISVYCGSGKVINMKDDSDISDQEFIPANSTILIYPNIHLTPKHYFTTVSPTSELVLTGAQCTPVENLIAPGKEIKPCLLIKTSKKINLQELNLVFRFNQID